MVLKELEKILNSFIIDLRTTINVIDDKEIQSRLSKILNEYCDRFDRLELDDENKR